jgi:hypothetical protein
MQFDRVMYQREFITLLSGAAVASRRARNSRNERGVSACS